MSPKGVLAAAAVIAMLLPGLPALAQAAEMGGVVAPPTTNSSGTPPPPVVGQSEPDRVPDTVRGVTAEPPPSTVGLAKPSQDGVGTVIVPARPCGAAARETDGTTTCVGVPARPTR